MNECRNISLSMLPEEHTPRPNQEAKSFALFRINFTGILIFHINNSNLTAYNCTLVPRFGSRYPNEFRAFYVFRFI